MKDPDGEIDEEDENESVYFVQLGEEILQVGHMQKRKAQQNPTEIAAEKWALSPALSAMVQAAAATRNAQVRRSKSLISLELICKKV